MQEHKDRRWVVLILAVLGLALLAAIPVVWASPLAQPLRQTVPPPPPPTPVVIIEEQVVEPGEPVTVTITIRNEGGQTMENCFLRLEPIERVEYLLDGQVLQVPARIPVGTLQPGQEFKIDLVVRLTEDAEPCKDYVITFWLECDAGISVVKQIVLTAPCPTLPEVGE